jgi:uncharacterized protein involved in exopolysaccharide biosynthesis
MTDNEVEAGTRQPLLDVFAILRQIWSRRVLILMMAGGLVLAAGLYLLVTKPVYTAQAIILVDPREPTTTATDNVLPGLGSDSAAISSQVAVIESRELLSTVFDAEGIEHDPEFAAPGLLASLLGKSPSRDEVFDNFTQNVSVAREGLTYVIDVGFLSRDPDKAARISNAIATQYIAGQLALKADANANVTGMLGDRIAELQQDVAEAERRVETFRAANRIFADTNGATQLQTQTEQLEAQLLVAQEAARQAETKAAQALAAGKSPQALISLSDILVSPTAESLRAEYNQRALDLSSNQSVLGPRHPTLRRLESELARVENLMVREVERITQELVGARDVAQGVVDRIKGELASLRAQGNDVNLKLVELRQLERSAEASRGVLEEFLKRSAETSQFERLQFSNARVITAATAPLRATWPKPSLVLSVAAALGLMAGLGTALLLGERKVPKPVRSPEPVIRRVLNGLRHHVRPPRLQRPPRPAMANPPPPATAKPKPATPQAQKPREAAQSQNRPAQQVPGPPAKQAPQRAAVARPPSPREVLGIKKSPTPAAAPAGPRLKRNVPQRTFIDLN